MRLDQITFAGHSAVIIKSRSFVVGIDPWLKGNPLCPESLQKPSRLDLIVLTHGHADHASDTLRLAAQCNSRIAATYELAQILAREGIPQERLIMMNKGGTVDVDGLKITLTNAFHSSSYDTADGAVYAGEPCGVVLQAENQSIYHAGDTSLFGDMALIGKRYQPSLAFLPIGDCFTMGPEEAAEAAKLIGCQRAIPIHYKTFDLLTGTAEAFRTACTPYDIEVVELEPGGTLDLK